MNYPLQNKVAIVTGASAGIGWATAEKLAAEGAAVVVNARRADRLATLVAKIEAAGGKAAAVAGDAGDMATNDTLLDKARTWGGRLDIVIVNAGRGLAGGMLTSDAAKWEEIYRLNVLGAADLMRKAGLQMVQKKSGDILVLGSVAGDNISPFSGFYGSTKWAIWSMAEAMRREVCAHGVRITCMKPAIVTSEFQDAAGYTYENFGKNIARFGKLLDPQDVANAIAFVVSQPPHVHVNELIIRPTGQDYP